MNTIRCKPKFTTTRLPRRCPFWLAITAALPLSACMKAPTAAPVVADTLLAAQLAVTATPAVWTADAPGVLDVRMQVQDGELNPGARIDVFIPPSWIAHAFHPDERLGGIYPYQTYDQLTEDLYSFVEIIADGQWELTIVPEGEDGTYHRIARKFSLVLKSGTVGEGNDIVVRYGSAERPIRASFIAESVSIPVRVTAMSGEPVVGSATVQTMPEVATALVVTGPAMVRVDAPFEISVTARDTYQNAAALPAALAVRHQNGDALSCRRASAYQALCETRWKSPEFAYVRAEAGPLTALSDPIRVLDQWPELQLFWGDLHSHSAYSMDGMGINPFDYARDVQRLDFYAATEHSANDSGAASDEPGITDTEWQEIREFTDAYYEAGRFVTLLAHEVSFPYPSGHHNVYYRDTNADVVRRGEVADVQALWQRLAAGEAFTVAHHTGITFSPGTPGAAVTWDTINNELRPLVEIYSAHGQSEYYDPDDELSYENQILTQRYKDWVPRRDAATPAEMRSWAGPTSVRGEHFVQDALKLGHEMGVIASSDDHTARPGQRHKGLVGLWADALTRESVFEALANRQTYATTGRRIYLDFRINGTLQGRHAAVSEPPEIELEVAAATPFKVIEIVAYNAVTDEYELVRRLADTDDRVVSLRFTDEEFSDRSFYYARVWADERINGRPVKAWSSPIWTKP